MKESILIDMLINGSTDAFNTIYDMYSKRLYFFSLKLCKSREVAEEIVQDTFTKLWINRESIQNKESISSLIFTIARNNLINSHRSYVNSPKCEEYLENFNNEQLKIDDTLDIIEYNDCRNQLTSAMRSLTDTQKKIFEYSKIDGLANREIAAKLRLSEQTIKNQLSISTKIIRSKFKLLILILFTYCIM